jgi:hypothetical protein
MVDMQPHPSFCRCLELTARSVSRSGRLAARRSNHSLESARNLIESVRELQLIGMGRIQSRKYIPLSRSATRSISKS